MTGWQIVALVLGIVWSVVFLFSVALVYSAFKKEEDL